MVDIVLQNTWALYHINKVEGDESLPLLACNFSKIFKGSEIIIEPCKNSNFPSDVCYEGAYYQVPSKKQDRCNKCKNNFRCRCVKCKANLHDICFEIFRGY